MSDGDSPAASRLGRHTNGHQEGKEEATPHHPILDGHRQENEDDHPVSKPPAEPTDDEDSDRSAVIELIGDIGIYLGLFALVLALIGILFGLFNLQPFANISLFFSLVFVTSSMILGATFQAFGTDKSLLAWRN